MQVDIRVVMLITSIVIFTNFVVIAMVIIVIVVIIMFTAQAQPKEQELPSQSLVSRVFQPHQGDLHICNDEKEDRLYTTTDQPLDGIYCTYCLPD